MAEPTIICPRCKAEIKLTESLAAPLIESIRREYKKRLSQKEIADLQEILKQRDAKLTEAQRAQVDLIRKQRKLDDAKREMELTVEKRIQEGLSTVREQAQREAEG